jgi:formylglycine-generating enzyme required for sulfatase activity
LTHDYLVPALRGWLTKKRRSTRSGRSELRLASRAAMWTAHSERRQLPTLWEWITISLFTRSRLWSEPQRKMMKSAARYHAFTAGFLAVVLVFFLFGGLEVTGIARDLLMQLRARSAAVWMAIGNEGAVWPLLKNAADPTLRTRVIHGLSPVDAEGLLAAADRQEDVSIRRAMLLVAGDLLGDLDEDWDTRADLRRNALPQTVISRLVDLYRNDPDPGIHAAAEWTLRQCGQQDQIARCDRELQSASPLGDRQWYVNGQGHTMVVIPGPTQFLMGSGEPAGAAAAGGRPHSQRIRRSFSIAAGETTVEEFRRFLEDTPGLKRDPADIRPSARPDVPERGAANWPDFPQTSVTWYEAAAYCNWLSRQEGLPEDEWCYLPNAAGEYAAGMRLADDYLDRRGYRLPTEPEWEYACRAGSATAYSFGSDASYLGHYGVYGSTSGGQPQPSGTRKPNDFGLFDMHGNVAEWCEDRHAPYPSADRNGSDSPPGYGMPASDSDRRVLRGGSFLDTAGPARCGARAGGSPRARQETVGFRVARSYP